MKLIMTVSTFTVKYSLLSLMQVCLQNILDCSTRGFDFDVIFSNLGNKIKPSSKARDLRVGRASDKACYMSIESILSAKSGAIPE